MFIRNCYKGFRLRKIILSRLNSFIISQNIPNDNQYEFHERHSSNRVIGGNANALIGSNLSNRDQCVSVLEESSVELPVVFGVPQ